MKGSSNHSCPDGNDKSKATSVLSSRKQASFSWDAVLSGKA